ncbi:MAG TPA: sterol desaturase family protein [Candidatus Binataceae bacterium]|nr:sterol desaturase family protein [Candidatus Binataceae bacterium]
MGITVAAFVAGLMTWTLLEYVIHGVMAHLRNTFVTRIHAIHHSDPYAVFAIKAWLPSVAILIVLLGLFGPAPGVVFYLGLACGFAAYEILHYRIHFAASLMPFERRLRDHHLVHHLRRPMMCLGVVTNFWDKVFGTEPARQELAMLRASVKDVKPLTGPSNLHRLISSFLS